MITAFRRFLIHIGKMLPFAICFVVCIGYTETLFLNLAAYGDVIIINTPIAFYVGQCFEYDLLFLVVMLTISVAIETCYWNKLAILYLCCNLYEIGYFAENEISEEAAFCVAILNVIISGFLAFKGLYLLRT